MTEWFEEWFGEEYLQLYPHRDAEDAARLVGLIATHLRLEGRRLLDLGCGPGRHAAQLRALGAQVMGFDLSMPLLKRAGLRLGTPPDLVRGDMRALPFAPNTFDVVVNLFTSFGYFLDDAQHRHVLAGAWDVLVAGGAFVIDYFNATRVRRNLVPHEEHTVGTTRIATERRISTDGRFVVKEIHVVNDGRSFLERVRLFTPDELQQMVQEAGFSVRARFGDYDGAPLSDTAPRAILIAHRS